MADYLIVTSIPIDELFSYSARKYIMDFMKNISSYDKL